MPGRAGLLTISEALADMRSIRMHENDSGVGGTDTSEIGGDARKGASGHGMLDDPKYTRIDAELVHATEAGLATKGEQGVGESGTQADYKQTSNAMGRTFGHGGAKRPED